jgi:hypothetical protein
VLDDVAGDFFGQREWKSHNFILWKQPRSKFAGMKPAHSLAPGQP